MAHRLTLDKMHRYGDKDYGPGEIVVHDPVAARQISRVAGVEAVPHTEPVKAQRRQADKATPPPALQLVDGGAVAAAEDTGGA